MRKLRHNWFCDKTCFGDCGGGGYPQFQCFREMHVHVSLDIFSVKSGFFWHQPEIFETGSASDKYEV